MMHVLRLFLWAVALSVLTPSARVDAATESITVTSDHTNVTLKWPRVADATWYNLYWQRTDTANTGENKVVNATSPYTHESLVPGATYRYRIVAANKNLERDTGLTAAATLPPAAPTLLDLQGSAHSTTLQWDKVPGANHYRIFWNTHGGVSTNDAGVTASQSPYTHKGLQSGARYYYRIAAQNAGGEGELSNEIAVQLPSDAPVIDAVSGGEGEATLSWSAVEAAESYNLYWNTYGGVTRDNTKKANVSAAYIHTGLLRGATYFYRLSALSAAGESELSPELSVTLAPAPPVVQLHTPSDPTHPTLMARLEWPAVFGATSYQVYWDTRPGVSSTANKISSVSSPFAPSEMLPGELRYYRVAAVNGGGESLSNEVAVALRPATPTIARSENTARQITLHAEPVQGATTYTLYWNTHANITSADNKIPAITLPYTHAGLTHGGSFYYRLSAQNVGGESALSPEVQVTLPPDMPVITGISGGNGQVQLKWNPVASSTSYVIYWNTTGNVGRTDAKANSSETQWLHGVLNNGAKYFYRVAAVNAGGESELAQQVSVILAPDAPRVDAVMSGEQQISVRWNTVAGATSYNLYWNSGTKVSVRDTKITAAVSPFVQDSLPKGATYSYLVSAVNEGGETLAAPLQATLIPDVPEPPLAQGGNKQTRLSWKPVPGATSYRVLWHSPGKFTAADGYLDAFETKEPSVIHTGLLNGSVYFYRVVAVNAGGKSAPSAEIKLTLAPDAPVIGESRGGDKQVTLAWNSVPGAASYTLYWQNSGDASAAENKIVDVATPYQHLNLSNGLSYHYRVAAVNAGGETASAPVRVTLIPDVPLIGKISGGDKQATLTWNAVLGVTAYSVYWNATGNVSERDASFDSAQTTHLQTALENGKTYFYRMSARNEEGASALSKEAAVTLAPDAPTLESALGGDRAVTLKWVLTAGATSYHVYWNTSGGVSATDNKHAMTTPLLALTNLTRGATYYFRIAALNAGGENLAPEISVTLAPGATTISSIKGGDKQSTLAWKTADGATEYHIYWNNKGNVTTRDPVLTTGASTFVHPGIKNGMKYFYRIAAANSGGESELSAESTVMLAPEAPQINFTSGEDKRITIGWDTVPGADTYNIYWKPLENKNAKPTKVTNATAPHVFTGLHNGSKYVYSITSVNSGGEGMTSEQVIVVPHNKKLLGLFPDPGLQRCITNEAAANGWVYGDEISGVLVCNDSDIQDLSGMEWLENLTNLSLRNNKIVDLSKLHGLTSLTYLALDTNTIEDLRPLTGLNKLNYLSLNSNPLSDLQPLAELQTLTSLYLNGTKVNDLTPLSQLVNLVYLLASNSEIVDVHPLSKLRNLARLYLSGNRIVDVKALANLTGLLELDISRNTIGDKAPGNVNALLLLKNVRLLMIGNNDALSCNEVTALIHRLGSPPVDLDGIITNSDLAVEDENCVKP